MLSYTDPLRKVVEKEGPMFSKVSTGISEKEATRRYLLASMLSSANTREKGPFHRWADFWQGVLRKK